MEVHLLLHLVVAGSNISCCLSVCHFHPRRPQAKVEVELWRKGNSVVVTSYDQIFFRSRSTFVCISDLSVLNIFFGNRSVSSWQDLSFRWKIYFLEIFHVHLSGIHFSPGNIFQKIFLHSRRLVKAAGLWARHVLALAEELFPAVIYLPNFRQKNITGVVVMEKYKTRKNPPPLLIEHFVSTKTNRNSCLSHGSSLFCGLLPFAGRGDKWYLHFKFVNFQISLWFCKTTTSRCVFAAQLEIPLLEPNRTEVSMYKKKNFV